MDVITTEDVIRSLIYDDNNDVVICQHALKLTNLGKDRILSEALIQFDANTLSDNKKQDAFIREVEIQLSNAALESTEEIDSFSLEYEGKTYKFVGIIPPSQKHQNHYFEWFIPEN